MPSYWTQPGAVSTATEGVESMMAGIDPGSGFTVVGTNAEGDGRGLLALKPVGTGAGVGVA